MKLSAIIHCCFESLILYENDITIGAFCHGFTIDINYAYNVRTVVNCPSRRVHLSNVLSTATTYAVYSGIDYSSAGPINMFLKQWFCFKP